MGPFQTLSGLLWPKTNSQDDTTSFPVEPVEEQWEGVESLSCRHADATAGAEQWSQIEHERPKTPVVRVQRWSHLASLHWGGQKNQLVRYCLKSTTRDCCQTRWTCRVPEYVDTSSYWRKVRSQNMWHDNTNFYFFFFSRTRQIDKLEANRWPRLIWLAEIFGPAFLMRYPHPAWFSMCPAHYSGCSDCFSRPAEAQVSVQQLFVFVDAYATLRGLGISFWPHCQGLWAWPGLSRHCLRTIFDNKFHRGVDQAHTNAHIQPFPEGLSACRYPAVRCWTWDPACMPLLAVRGLAEMTCMQGFCHIIHSWFYRHSWTCHQHHQCCQCTSSSCVCSDLVSGYFIEIMSPVSARDVAGCPEVGERNLSQTSEGQNSNSRKLLFFPIASWEDCHGRQQSEFDKTKFVGDNFFCSKSVFT